ncbi:hypothetical protein MCEREM21A_02421 [Sphingomonadaceae bacterium]
MGDINLAYYETKSAAGRLRKLGQFYSKFSDPSFEFMDGASYMLVGTWLIEEDPEYTEIAVEFIRTCIKDRWVISGFHWHDWSQNDGAQFFENPTFLMDAHPIDLAKTLTVIFGREHAKHGYLIEAYENGLLLTLVKRAQQLSALETLQEAA